LAPALGSSGKGWDNWIMGSRFTERGFISTTNAKALFCPTHAISMLHSRREGKARRGEARRELLDLPRRRMVSPTVPALALSFVHDGRHWA